MAYIEVTHETILALKSLGFKSCEMNLHTPDDPIQAKVEVIPYKEFNMNKKELVSLNDKDLSNYFDKPSPMAKYVIDESYLVNVTVPKLQ